MNKLQIRCLSIIAVLVITVIRVTGQTAIPDILTKNSIVEQLNYLDEHTRIYENYRAIREDMFQKIKVNVSDTLSVAKSKIVELNKSTFNLNLTIDSLRKTLESTTIRLQETTASKNSIRVIGLEINKLTYNKIMLTLLAGLVALLLTGFLVFRRNLSIIFSTKKEFQELKNEFETYKKTSREAREKLTMYHFKELKKLKEG